MYVQHEELQLPSQKRSKLTNIVDGNNAYDNIDCNIVINTGELISFFEKLCKFPDLLWSSNKHCS